MDYETMRPSFMVGRGWYTRVDTSQPFSGMMSEATGRRSVGRLLEFSGGLTMLLEVTSEPGSASAEITLTGPPG